MRVLVALMIMAVALSGCASQPEPVQDNPVDDVQEVLPIEVDVEMLLDDLQQFVTDFPQRKGNHADHVGARDWMAAQFESFGLEVYRQEFTQGIDQENIVGILWGNNTEEWVTVGGHYDMTTTGSSHDQASAGAYDDGSGTMMTLHMAKAWAASGIVPEYTIAFVMFDGEERGLQGSGAFAEAFFLDGATPYGNLTSRGMLNLDMFGLNWPAIDAPIYFDENSPELQAVVEAKRLELGMPDSAIQYQGISLGRSDYAHFMALGVPTGFFISDFEQWQLPGGKLPVVGGVVIPQGAYPFWHVADTWETMVLMAGSEEALHDSFEVAVELANVVLETLSSDVPLSASVQ